jgi:PKD repeat protein
VVTVDEGSLAVNGGSAVDPDGSVVGLTASIGSLTFDGSAWGWEHVPLDGPATRSVQIRALDDRGETGFGTFDLVVYNVPPQVGAIAGPAAPVQVDTPIDITVVFTDPGAPDLHTGFIAWGDGSPPCITGDDPNCSLDEGTGIVGSVAASHAYAEPGIYTVQLGVTDDDGGPGTSILTVYVSGAPVVTAEPTTQDVQYSDHIGEVTIDANAVADVLSAETSWSENGGGFVVGLPGGLAFTADGCSPSNGIQTCVWTLAGIADVPEGAYTVRVTVGDNHGGETTVDITIVVEPEDATLRFHGGNPVALKVIENESGPFELTVDIREKYPDAGTDPLPGDISLTGISMQLVPIGPGSGATGACATDWVVGTGYDAVKRATCSFDAIPINTYAVQVSDINGYYAGRAEDVLTVYDPSSGQASGAGTFIWPDTEDETKFGFTMEYNKKGSKVKGSLMLVRHVGDGSVY